MNIPIIDPCTLTEEQIKDLCKIYFTIKTYMSSKNKFIRDAGDARYVLFNALFGEEFFKDEERNK